MVLCDFNRVRPVRRHFSVWLMAAAVSLAAARAEEYRVTRRSAFTRALDRANPGDRILLEPGNYGDGMLIHSLRGRPGAPIVIAAADPERRPVFEGQLHFSRCAWLHIRGLHVAKSNANGMNFDEGGPTLPASEGLIIEHCVVENAGPRGNLDGIKASGLKGFIIRDCTISDWGDGGSGIDLVGCRDGLVEGCRLSHHAAHAASGIQAKGGSARILITGNRLERAGTRAVNLGGSTGEEFFRPPGRHDTEASELWVIGNTFRGSMTPVAFTSSRDCEVSFNQIDAPDKWIFRVLQEKPVPRYRPSGGHRFAHNRIVFRRSQVRVDVNVGPDTEPESLVIEGNSWWAEDQPDQSRPRLPVEETGGSHGDRDGAVDAAARDARIRAVKDMLQLPPE